MVEPPCADCHRLTSFCLCLSSTGWKGRSRLPLDIEEAATALFLKHGDLDAAAARLKVTPARLNRVVRRSPRLMRLKAVLRQPSAAE